MATHKRLWCAALLAAATLLGGCSTKFGPGQLARDWSCKMREMQIRPLFPPREDVQVGDVFVLARVADTDARAYCSGSDKDGDYLPLPVHLGYVPNVMKTAKAHYEGRPDFPRTTPAGGTVTLSATAATVTFAPASTSVIEGTDSFFVQGRAHRTRLVGFPDFMSVKIDRASLGAIIPIQGVFTPFGLSMEDVEDASISIPVAESYGVPVATAWAAFPPADRASMCALAATVAGSGSAGASGVVMVHEVFYTRAIDISIQSRRAAAFGIGRDREGAGAVTVPAVTSTGIVSPAASVTQQGSATVAHMGAVVQGVAQILAARNNVPGVSFSAEQGRSTSINMRRVFDRPVAIGYRSIPLSPVRTAGGCTFAVGQSLADNGATPAFTNLLLPGGTGLGPALMKAD
jgi:hypothetical protein